VGEVDRPASNILNLFDLVFVENVVQGGRLGGRFISVELDRWESELWLLHVVVNLLVEVLAHVGLKNHWEVVSVPVSLAASLQSEAQTD
jgi:hypothetical protein